MKKMIAVLTLLALLALSTVPTLVAQDAVECETDYTVQAGDWLSKIAEKYLGDVMSYPAIVDATNAKAGAGSAYATIDDPNLIEPGWKLCIPPAGEAGAAPAQIILRPPAVRLDDGVQCFLAGEGATLAFNGQRLNYTCKTGDGSEVGLLGDLIEINGVLSAQKVTLGHNDAGFFVKSSETVTATPISVPMTINNPSAGAVTADALSNTEYALGYTQSGQAPLVNGEYREPAAPGSATEIVIRLYKSSVAGDLNGDGKNDGAAILVSDPGGSGTFYDLAAVVMQDGKPVNVASVFLGDRIKVQSVSIDAKGTIIVEMLTRKADEPMAAEPTEPATRFFTLQGNQLIEQAAE